MLSEIHIPQSAPSLTPTYSQGEANSSLPCLKSRMAVWTSAIPVSHAWDEPACSGKSLTSCKSVKNRECKSEAKTAGNLQNWTDYTIFHGLFSIAAHNFKELWLCLLPPCFVCLACIRYYQGCWKFWMLKTLNYRGIRGQEPGGIALYLRLNWSKDLEIQHNSVPPAPHTIPPV